MNEFDRRQIDRQALEEIRIRAVKRVGTGESPEVVIKALGITRPRIHEWLAKYREGGVEALRSRKATGRPARLTGSHLQKIYKMVVGKDPRQLKFEFALWTRGMIREVIKREFGVKLSEISVGRLLKKLGLSPQRPKHRACQQDSGLVMDWMTKDFPTIKKMAREEKAEIYFGDEASVRSDCHSGTTWAPKGKTPVVTSIGSRFKVNLISAISARGAMRFMATEENLTAPVFCEFLQRLIAHAKRPIYLIVDNHPVHRAKVVLDFVRSTNGRLKLFYLPPYSPELNTDKLVWNDVKNHKVGHQTTSTRKDFFECVRVTMLTLQKLSANVRSFFRHPII